MSRVVCRAYGAGVWNGVEFREQEIDGHLVGVAQVEGEALDWFRAHPHTFHVEEPPALGELREGESEENQQAPGEPEPVPAEAEPVEQAEMVEPERPVEEPFAPSVVGAPARKRK